MMNASTLSIPTAIYGACAYLFMLPLSFFFAALAWWKMASGVLYCSDDLFIFDFIPPFVNPDEGDVYRVPARRVYLLWCLVLAGALLLPGLVIWCLRLVSGREEQYGH